ncbi:MCE family protein [Gordonia sp. LSe1-13]|uniref:MCE family protein n=1 Tax=Gordonia sesuvii TaxID=3116777 RepID=A0ABU7M8I6_9ACTN|nr:MCE family protein [Gordonia sp. LSe1-13]
MKTWLIRLLVVGVVALLAVGGYRVLRDDAADTVDVIAQFDSASGLFVGNAVSVLGMQVGEITRITPRATAVEVAMSIDGDVPVPADVSAVTVSTSVLTDRHIELTPVYRSGPRLADDAVIDLSRTKTPVDVDRSLAMADELALSLDGDGNGNGPIADILSAGAATTSGNGDDIRSALTALSEALALGPDHGADTREALTATVDNLSTLSDAAARNDGAIRRFGSAIEQLADLFAEKQLGWGTTGAQLNRVLAEATTLLEQRRTSVRNTVSSAETVTRALADSRRQLAEFLDVTPLLLDNAYNSIDQRNGIARVHAQLEKVFFDSQLVKEVCNVLRIRELGCNTGTLRDFGPDFGMSAMLEGLAGETP